MRFGYCEAEVRSYSVSVVYVVLLRIVFSKAALQKRGSMEHMKPPLDPPLLQLGVLVIIHDHAASGIFKSSYNLLSVVVMRILSNL